MSMISVVLDASFNPPTICHQYILLTAIQLIKQSHPNFNIHVIISISRTNVDKRSLSEEQLARRIRLMRAFLEDLRPHLAFKDKVEGVVVFDDAPLFFDKLKILLERRIVEAHEALPIYFVMGDDVLVRLINRQYYLEWDQSVLRKAIHDFLQAVKIIVVLRNCIEAKELWNQLEQSECFELEKWKARVTIVLGEESFRQGSSTKVRQYMSIGNFEGVRKLTSPSVYNLLLDKQETVRAKESEKE